MLAEIPAVTVQDIGTRKCGIVTFSVVGVDATKIESGLREQGIGVSVSSPFSTLIDARRRELPDLVRSAVHYYNLDKELDALVARVREMAN
jgi:selenocysteine lyase/cysteine desulfurase